MRPIYKICPRELWEEARAAGVFTGAPVDRRDGFIHFSTAEQVKETARRHFTSERDLVLVVVDSDALGDALRFEPSRGGDLFPHLYGTLPLSAVRSVRELPVGPDGVHTFPRVPGVIGRLFPFAKPVLHGLDPETAHALTIRALSFLPALPARSDHPRLRIEILGRRFPNPVGLAAGYDKQCEVPDQLLALGFGFVELGGVVPQPQPGNPQPRVFRLTRDEAIINRLGLNSDGLAVVRERLERRRGRPGIVGVNVGANKDSRDRIADYVTCAEGLSGLVDFLTVNVSSPNTPGLRDLQGEAFLDEILARAVEACAGRGASARKTALLLKIAPDLSLDALDSIVATVLRRGLDGLIVSNTTVTRPASLQDRDLAKETGGLSGCPLFRLSTKILAETALRHEGRLPIIGVGGIDSAEAAWTKIRAGASLVQLYSALVYHGPDLISQIKDGLLRRVEQEHLPSLTAAVGRDAAAIARDFA